MRLRIVGLAILYAAVTGASARAPDVRVEVVVNAANPTTSLKREQLAEIFLRRTSTWSTGGEILPVDQIDRSPAYVAFARDVLRQSENALRRYWQERIFSGNESPPPERVTDGEVLVYVRSNVGAIGYVRAGTDLGAGVKSITIADR